ncbi:hypothetical protein RCC89_13105 [Cytophagaceae bacterium ABcell3]|nr:hypothetical protein RCC89_13105 [Cytophagaceae bacterium ABcell3]
MRTKLITLILFLSATILCNAQTKKGSYMVGGYGNADFTTSYAFKTVISPNIGYFLADGFALGGGPILGLQSGTYNSYIGGLNLFSRYYIGLSPSVQLFGQVQGNFIYTHHKTRRKYPISEDILPTNSFVGTFGGGLGVAYFITEQVSLEALFRYDRNNNRKSKNIFTLDFGFQIYFPRQ